MYDTTVQNDFLMEWWSFLTFFKAYVEWVRGDNLFTKTRNNYAKHILIAGDEIFVFTFQSRLLVYSKSNDAHSQIWLGCTGTLISDSDKMLKRLDKVRVGYILCTKIITISMPN